MPNYLFYAFSFIFARLGTERVSGEVLGAERYVEVVGAVKTYGRASGVRTWARHGSVRAGSLLVARALIFAVGHFAGSGGWGFGYLVAQFSCARHTLSLYSPS
ncbi:MAG: hypothetical protein JWR69_1874 [Pedosphaera sp.]|nr:hypothetical protein [Pedosphaera sp.]